MRVFFAILTVCVMSVVASIAAAQDYGALSAGFDATRYSTDELRFLQLGLAEEGYYDGLLDGDWGALSERALAKYANDVTDDRPRDIHAAGLALSAAGFVGKSDWEYRYFADLGLSLLIPSKTLVKGATSPDFLNYEMLGSSLNYSFATGNQTFTDRLHSYALDFNDVAQAPYVVRREGLAITSATNRQGRALYVRSRYWKGRWSTVMISANSEDQGLLAVVSGSLSDDPEARLFLPDRGHLARLAALLLQLLPSEGDGPAANADAEPSGTPPGGSDAESAEVSGTGFAVARDGLVLTNAHVIDGCSAIQVAGHSAVLLAESGKADLALLRTASSATAEVARFSPDPAKLNEDVTVAGYPLAGFLGGINVTRGAVSSLSGIRGDTTRMQITAPVQPGNSGGPVLSIEGEVLGIVVSKLDALKVADAIGDIPQNVNFAVRGEVAVRFLEANGVEPVMNKDFSLKAPTRLAEYATKITVLITCH